MHKIELSYQLAPGRAQGGIHHPLMALLLAVRAHGSITGAARALGQSYRHVWGELRRWEAQLGRELIVWDKGQPARLTPFGDKLLWAERHAQARLAPQIEALHAGLEQAYAVAFDDAAQVLSLHASHDDALVLLREVAAERGLHLDVHFCGSVDALSALNEGRCTLAGFHALPTPPVGGLAQRTLQPLMQPGRHKMIGFARRWQGLVVAPGNPHGVRDLADVARAGLRYANRPLGTGTRLLAEQLLHDARLGAQQLRGWDRAEASHAAVAQAVASGAADAGLAIESAAVACGLGFVRLVEEDYWLVCLASELEQPPMRALRTLLADALWQARLAQLPGYRAHAGGEVMRLAERLPWWSLAPRRVQPGANQAAQVRKPKKP